MEILKEEKLKIESDSRKEKLETAKLFLELDKKESDLGTINWYLNLARDTILGFRLQKKVCYLAYRTSLAIANDRLGI